MNPIMKALAVALPLAGAATNVSAALKPASDFDGDGRSDLMWRHYATGADAIWLSADFATSLSMATVADV